MIVVRFAVRCKPEKADEAEALFRDVVSASRALQGVVSFDIGRDVSDTNRFVATEVFENRDALDLQESIPARPSGRAPTPPSRARSPVADDGAARGQWSSYGPYRV